MLKGHFQNSSTFFSSSASRNIQSLVLLNRVIDKFGERVIRAAQLPRDDRSPLSCAAKHRPNRNFDNPRAFENEAQIHDLLSYDHQGRDVLGILPFMGIYSNNAEYGPVLQYLVTPECDVVLSGCLGAIREMELRNAPLFHYIIYNIMHGMLSGLFQLGEHKVVHNDLTMNNIGFFRDSWRIFDFGEAESYEQFCGSDSHIKGSPLYIAPEVCARENALPFARDVWALGQIFRELLGKEVMLKGITSQVSIKEFIARKAAVYRENRQKLVDEGKQCDENYQKELLLSIGQEKSLKNAIRVLVDSMCEILPEYRPNIETLKLVIIQLSSLSASENVNTNEYQQFMRSLIEAHRASIYAKATFDSDTDPDGSPVVVVDLDSNAASPIQKIIPSLSATPLALNKTLTPGVSMQLVEPLDIETGVKVNPSANPNPKRPW